MTEINYLWPLSGGLLQEHSLGPDQRDGGAALGQAGGGDRAQRRFDAALRH